MTDTRHIDEERLVLYHYEGEDRARVEQHLRDCASCRDEYTRLRNLFLAIERAPVPDRPADYGEQTWQRVSAELGLRKPAGPRRATAWPLALAAGLLLLVGGAFWLGRLWPATEPIPEQARERVLFVAVGDHLESSQRMLVELIRAGSADGVDASSQRDRAQQLAANNRIYKQSAARSGDTVVADLLEELGRILAEIANSPTELGDEELTALQREIRRGGIMLKIRVVGEEAQRRAGDV